MSNERYRCRACSTKARLSLIGRWPSASHGEFHGLAPEYSERRLGKIFGQRDCECLGLGQGIPAQWNRDVVTDWRFRPAVFAIRQTLLSARNSEV
jgi:hypothetical protein